MRADQLVRDVRPAAEWPNNGIMFNRWYTGLTRFMIMLRHFYWGNGAHRFKYVNIRIDTRNGNFIVLSDDSLGEGGSRIDPNEIAKHVDMAAVDAELAKMRG